MRWPWSRPDSRDALIAQLRDENVWLRGRVEALEAKRERIERKEAGLPEVGPPAPAAPRRREPTDRVMPSRLRNYIMRQGSTATQQMMIDEAYRRLDRGQSWQQIMDATLGSPNGAQE